MKWSVEIQKTSLERRNLADLLDGLGFALIDGIQFPAFTSPEFEVCDTAAEVFERAKRLRSAFTVANGVDPEFTLGAVLDYAFNPPKPNLFLDLTGLVCNTSLGKFTVTVSPPSGLSTDEIEKWKADQAKREYEAKLENQRAKFEPAFLELRAAKMLELLLIKNPSGEIIYKIYELAEGTPDKRNAFHKQFGIPIDQFDRFTDTVHNQTVSGDWARHAYEKEPKTPNPMSIGEAEEFVRSIASKWLKYIRTSYIPTK